ncbi:MAG: FAD-dependent monooxygenase [Planctomycetes bacterium]|nr:FAD-dependent monooxygenase [Planctomycetota bacterium]
MSERGTIAIPIAIIGAGSTGLAAAIALAKRGFDVRVFERAERLDALGAGITLWSNALCVLRELGVAERLIARADPLVRGETRRVDGSVLAAFEFVGLAREFGAPCIAVHRGVLQEELLRACSAPIEFGAELVNVREGSGGVELEFGGGRRERAALVIGADGVRSRVRAVLGGEEPVYSGYVAYRAVQAFSRELVPSGLAFETWGAAKRFGALRLDAENVYWFAALDAPRDSSDTRRRETLLAHFGGWHAPIRELIESTPEQNVLRHDVIELARPAELARGRVALAGDAAHAMTPNLGQGACVGLEDALVVARAIERRGATAEALASYARARRARVERVARDSRRAGRWGQIENPALRWMRDAALASVARPLLARMVRKTLADGIASLTALD